MNTADPRHYTLPKTNLYIETETFSETGASPLLKPLPMLEKVIAPMEASRCRHCRHYSHEGRRGGQCAQLKVVVQGNWAVCGLAEAAFLEFYPMTSSLSHEISPY